MHDYGNKMGRNGNGREMEMELGILYVSYMYVIGGS